MNNDEAPFAFFVVMMILGVLIVLIAQTLM